MCAQIERVVCSRRDTLRVNIVWPEELVDAIKNASHLRWERVEPTDDCEACNRSGHLATFRVFYSGVSCDATELYRDGWMERCVPLAALFKVLSAGRLTNAFDHLLMNRPGFVGR